MDARHVKQCVMHDDKRNYLLNKETCNTLTLVRQIKVMF